MQMFQLIKERNFSLEKKENKGMSRPKPKMYVK